MPNVEPLTLELADGNKPAGVPNCIDGNDTTASTTRQTRRRLQVVKSDSLNNQTCRSVPSRDEPGRGREAKGLKLPPPISGRKWCPHHLEAIRLNHAGICPICMTAPEAVCASTASTDGRVRPVDCKDGARLNAGRVSDQAKFGAARPPQQHGSLACPAKGCAATSAVYAAGSYYGRDGKLHYVWYEATCVNGHSHLASRLAPEDVKPELPAVQAAPVPEDARGMFDRVVETHYDKLLRIARNRLPALDGGRIPGAEDCVHEAVAALVRDGSYAPCGGEGEMFGQLVVAVKNRAKAWIKTWDRDRTRHRPLVSEHVRRRHWSDGNDEIVGKGFDRELGSDGGKRGSRAADSELRPRPVEQTRDLQIDAKWALFEEAVPLDAQAVLVGETTRKEIVGRSDFTIRLLRTSLFDNHMLEHQRRLGKRLLAYRTTVGVKGEKSVHDSRMVPNYSAHRKFIRRWVDDAVAELRVARQRYRSHMLEAMS